MTYNVFSGTLNLTQSINQSMTINAAYSSHWLLLLLLFLTLCFITRCALCRSQEAREQYETALKYDADNPDLYYNVTYLFS